MAALFRYPKIWYGTNIESRRITDSVMLCFAPVPGVASRALTFAIPPVFPVPESRRMMAVGRIEYAPPGGNALCALCAL
ncbi:MAG: hypothetical protein WDM92_01710 [Caulobacteraceae bacterium]